MAVGEAGSLKRFLLEAAVARPAALKACQVQSDEVR